MNIQRPGSLWGRSSIRGRPVLPAELLDLSEEEYRNKLREFGFSEDAAEAEVTLFREYLETMKPKKLIKPVERGPVKNKLYEAWKTTARSRRVREEKPDGEKEI